MIAPTRIFKLTVGALLSALMLAAGTNAARAAEPPTNAGEQREVVAVFNFAQRDDNPKYAWLSKGLADLLINQLADLPQISIVSRDRMQLLISEYESVLHKSLKDSRPELRMAGDTLSAKRVVFGTYAVSGDDVTLTLQVSGVSEEAVLFQAQVKGKYSEALNLERELARRLRAFFLGQAADKVPLTDVPQWTSQVGSAEHLYSGVDLFDQGNYAEAWLRFRQAAKADSNYADAFYWQGRMFYYLALYDNARPLLNDFFNRWPHHPRASDAAIELLDTWRQTMDDPAALGKEYLGLRDRVDPRAIVYNKALPGQESRSLLRSYIGGFAVQALRQQQDYEAAAKLATEVMIDSWQAKPPDDDSAGWDRGLHNILSRVATAEAALKADKIVVEKKIFGDKRIGLVSFEQPYFFVRDGGSHRMHPRFVRHGDKYVMQAVIFYIYALLPPEGYQFSKIKSSVTPHHEPNSQPFLGTIDCLFDGDKVAGTWCPTDQGPVTNEFTAPHRCRYLLVKGAVYPQEDAKNHVSPTQIVSEISPDYLEETRLDFTFEPLPPDDYQIRLNLGNQTDVRISIDGQATIQEEGLIRGVTPGKHVISVTPFRGTGGTHSEILQPVKQEVTVAEKGITECTIVPPFTIGAQAAGWRNTVTLARDYPLAKQSPIIGQKEISPPVLLRVQRGSRRGQLVSMWSFHENLWLSYSQDDGAHWTPTERLPIPVDTAHNQLAPQLIQDESGRFCLAFISDRGIERAHYPYVCWSDDLQHWSAPIRVAPVVVDKIHFLQDQHGRYLLLLPPLWRPDGLGWRAKKDGANVVAFERTELTKAMQQKYGRRKAVLMASTDLIRWTELENNLGTPELRDVDLVQTADGLFHAVFTQQSDQQPDGYRLWALEHQTSPDAAHWGLCTPIVDKMHWEIDNPRITTDGREILGSYCLDINHVLMFKIGTNAEFDWWGWPSERNSLYFDPPGFGGRFHWLWLKEDFVNENRNEGQLYYTSCDATDSAAWYERLTRKPPVEKPEAHSDRKAKP